MFLRDFHTRRALPLTALLLGSAALLPACDPGAELASGPDAFELEADAEAELIHVDNRGEGCPLAALAGELSRGQVGGRREGCDAMQRVSQQLKHAEDTAQGIATLALMLGTVTLARLAENANVADCVLDAGRKGVELIQRDWVG